MRILVVAPNVGLKMGGEALKAYQYFKWLLENGRDAVLVAHERSRDQIDNVFPSDRVIFLPDLAAERLAWRSRIGRPGMDLLFHRRVRDVVPAFPIASTVVHYLCPISPIEPRFPPSGYQAVLGPISGNIYYPPAFGTRSNLRTRAAARLHMQMQRLSAAVLWEKRRFKRILVSGGERTKASLRCAGAVEGQFLDVEDAGLEPAFLAQPPVPAVERERDFVFVGRLQALKGVDLAIRAVARADSQARLTIYGEGDERAGLEALAKECGVAERVRFAGWLPHSDVPSRLRACRGFVFPSMTEANGIVVQEAMALGLPVLALRWGGPERLVDAGSGFLIEPRGPTQVVDDLAAAMTALMRDDALVDRLAAGGHAAAVARFSWSNVARTWAAAYPDGAAHESACAGA